MKTLFQAIYARFHAYSDLANNVTDIFLNEAPQNVVYPYIVVTLISGTEEFDSDNYREDAMLEFNIYSKEISASEVTDIYEYLKGGFDFHALSVSGYTTLILKRETFKLEKVEKIWKYNANYKCWLNEAA